MSRYSMIWLLLLSVAFSSAFAQSSKPSANLETTIRILIIHDPGVDQAFIDSSIQFLQDSWSGTPGTRSASITIVNPGASIPVPLPGTSALVVLESIRSYANSVVPPFAQSARTVAAADLVIAFTDNDLFTDDGTAVCAATQQGDWLGTGASFSDAADGVLDGVDTSPANKWFVAVVEEDCSGDFGSMAHEFGHLLGTQHESGGSAPLFPNGRGDFFYINIPYFLETGSRTIMAVPQACGLGSALLNCGRLPYYSNSIVFGNPSRQSIDTIDHTALSVANFVRTPPSGTPPPPPLPLACADGEDNDGDMLVDSSDPDCSGPTDDDESSPPPPPIPPGVPCDPSSYVPSNVTVRLTALCPTQYEVRWQHACPGNDYEVWGNDGLGPYFVLPTPVQAAIIQVVGPSTVQVRACAGLLCSPLSLPPVPVNNRC